MSTKPTSLPPSVKSTNPKSNHPTPWKYFGSIEDYRQYTDFLNKSLKNAPFNSTTINRIKELTENSVSFSIQSITDIDSIKLLLDDLRRSLNIFDNSNKAVTAYINIKITKLMIIVEDKIKQDKGKLATEKDKNELALSIRNKIFSNNKQEKSTYYAHKKIANIPNVEAYCFIGIDKLRDISSLIDYTKEDPIGELFSKYNYKFDISILEETDDFSLKLRTMINHEILKSHSLSPTHEAVQEYTKNNPKLTKPAVLRLIRQIKEGSTINDVLNNKQHPVKLQLDDNKAPLYNEFEERCLQLMDIFEDIINDDYVPEFNPIDFKILLETLHDMNSDLYAFWKESWEGFDNGE